MQSPPNTKNFSGQERKIGWEIEYAGLSLKQSSDIVKHLFGGCIDKENDAVFKVKNTELGDFELVLDATHLQKIAAATGKLETNSDDNLIDDISIHVGKLVNKAGAKITPFEIVTPPIALSDLSKMEKLRKALLKAGAEDTKKNIYTAFGVHINPEVASLETDYILRHLQSFLLLEPWLKQLHNIDLTRKVTSFIDPFPKSYINLLLDNCYETNTEQLILDYHRHNPTRNRSLDMLPLFAYINEDLVRELFGEKEKINKRPTFHYRLPNSELADEDWSFNTEWSRWLNVETLADDKQSLHKLINQWQIHHERWFSFELEWAKEIATAMEK